MEFFLYDFSSFGVISICKDSRRGSRQTFLIKRRVGGGRFNIYWRGYLSNSTSFPTQGNEWTLDDHT